MPIFIFKARDTSGQLITGELEADTFQAAQKAIALKGLIPTELQQHDLNIFSFPLFQRKPSTKDIANLTLQFQAMFTVGTPMDRILSLLARQVKNKALKKAMVRIQKDVASGTRLSIAFKAFPDYFSPLYISMLEVGEVGGVLDKTLKEMADILQKESEIHKKIKTAMLYPKVVLSILFAAAWGMLVFVIPPFKKFYSGYGAELPLPTQIVITISNLLTSYWYIILIGGVAVFWFWKRFSKTSLGRDWISRIAFQLPVFGRLNRLTANARFGHLLSALYRAGVPLAHALGVIAHTMTNTHYVHDVLNVKSGLERGKSFSQCIELTKHFEPMIQESISVGEKTGRLDVLLDSTANFYDSEIDNMLKNMSTLIEPILLMILFSGVTLLALAIYLPIWNLSNVVLQK